jgi:hypothetical protein
MELSSGEEEELFLAVNSERNIFCGVVIGHIKCCK